ncbi:MAG: hypothetical protein ACRD6N_01995, partial [Pyrinomonadaceae bacterium]
MNRHKFSQSICKRVVGVCVVLLSTGTIWPSYAQAPSSFDIERGRIMLKVIKEDLKKNYYDPAYRGMDVEARFKTADEKMKQATSLGQIMGIIAQALL